MGETITIQILDSTDNKFDWVIHMKTNKGEHTVFKG